ncbi:DUF58 domain-containing protein [Roseateles cellulosilyticus]|uniref:DUF58 domain-containing protein n=1 Tax=Pelomonas cellulosilytica TaxID=2906762 RepID=A0ABS8Y490_9BURK|nr:DUF58 domain-containing protein [Pelomonas sp. P8]MCE4557946.1 DUF58 domain-containing protein [Pelomonas sp. P8]
MMRWKTAAGAAPGAAQAAPMDGDALFDAAFVAALEPFVLRIAQAQRGGRLAEQRSTARGQGVDFADYKPYVEGDDLRSVDWNTYRRLGKAFVRVYEERQDLPVYLLVDLSRSMFAETPPRIQAALQTALGLAAIALHQQDNVSLLPFSDGLQAPVRALSGGQALSRVMQTLAGYRAAGGSGLAQALAQAAAMPLRRGLMVVISDFFDPAGADAVTTALAQVPHALLLVQMVRDHDTDPRLHPDLQGDVQISDGESSDLLPLTLTPELVERYQSVRRAFQQQLATAAAAVRGQHVTLDAAQPVLAQLTALFSDGGLWL